MSKLKFPHVNLVRPKKYPGHVQPFYALAAGRPYMPMREPDNSISIFTDDNEGRKEARAYARKWLAEDATRTLKIR